MSDKKIAVFFPGIGYTNEKPLMYYSRKLAAEHDYEVLILNRSHSDVAWNTDCYYKHVGRFG